MNGEAMPKCQTEKPKFLHPKLNRIPDELCGFNNWVVWKAVIKGGKWAKVPFNPKNGKPASSTDPATWSVINSVCHTLGGGGYDGIGFMLSKDNQIIGIDLDHCRNPGTGEIKAWAHEIIKSIDSYTEISPSGTGIRIFVIAKLPPNGRKKGNIEMYDSKRYLTVTGYELMGLHRIRSRQEEVEQLHNSIFGEQKVIDIQQAKEFKTNNLEDEKVIEKALAASNSDKFQSLYNGDTSGYPSQSEADLALCNHLAFWCNGDAGQIDRIFRTSGLYREKWDREDYSQRTIDNAITSFSNTYKGNREIELHENNRAIQPPLDSTDKAPEESSANKVKDPQLPPSKLVFPDIMSGLAGDFAKLYGQYLESPEHFFYTAFLTVFGLSVADTLYLKSQCELQPRLYLVILGESAQARKSTALEEVVKFFKNFFKQGTFAVCRGAASGEGLAKVMEESKKALLYYDELKMFVSKCNIKQSTLLTATNTLFESNCYENRTSKNSIVIENAYVSMLAASTIDTFAGMFNDKFMHIGFINRLFLVPGDTDKCFPFPKEIPQGDIKELHNQLQERLALIQNMNSISITPNAEKLWAEYYVKLKEMNSPFTKRLDTYGLRLMPLIAINDSEAQVDEVTVQKVIDLIRWQHNIREIHDPKDIKGTVAKMEERIRRALSIKPKWRKTDLQRRVNYSQYGIWVFDQAVKNLEKNDECIFNAKSKSYRKP
jgi:hypothetical protein